MMIMIKPDSSMSNGIYHVILLQFGDEKYGVFSFGFDRHYMHVVTQQPWVAANQPIIIS